MKGQLWSIYDSQSARRTFVSFFPLPLVAMNLGFVITLLGLVAFGSCKPTGQNFTLPLCNSPEAEAAAQVALDFINAQHTHGYKYTLNQIEDIKVINKVMSYCCTALAGKNHSFLWRFSNLRDQHDGSLTLLSQQTLQIQYKVQYKSIGKAIQGNPCVEEH